MAFKGIKDYQPSEHIEFMQRHSYFLYASATAFRDAGRKADAIAFQISAAAASRRARLLAGIEEG